MALDHLHQPGHNTQSITALAMKRKRNAAVDTQVAGRSVFVLVRHRFSSRALVLKATSFTAQGARPKMAPASAAVTVQSPG